MTPSTPRHVGIVACSAEGASLCYRTLCSEGATLLGAYGHPEVSLHTHPHSAYVRCLERNDWSGVAELMRPAADPRFDAPARARCTEACGTRQGLGRLTLAGAPSPPLKHGSGDEMNSQINDV